MERFVKVSKFSMLLFCLKLDKRLSVYDARAKMIDKFGAKTLYTRNGKNVYKLITTDRGFRYKLNKLNKPI